MRGVLSEFDLEFETKGVGRTAADVAFVPARSDGDEPVGAAAVVVFGLGKFLGLQCFEFDRQYFFPSLNS